MEAEGGAGKRAVAKGRPGRGTASVGLRHVGHGLPGSLGGIQT